MDNNTFELLKIIIPTAATLVLGYFTYKNGLKTDKVAAVTEAGAAAAASKVEEVRTDLKVQGDVAVQKLDTIHTAVNSERTAMLAKIEVMHAEILRLSGQILSLSHDKARLEGKVDQTDPAVVAADLQAHTPPIAGAEKAVAAAADRIATSLEKVADAAGKVVDPDKKAKKS